jgi:hypothetical protein
MDSYDLYMTKNWRQNTGEDLDTSQKKYWRQNTILAKTILKILKNFVRLY